MSTGRKKDTSTANPFLSDMTFWENNWTGMFRDMEQRMRRMQEITDEMRETMLRTSQHQFDGVLEANTRAMKLLADAAQSREPGELLSAQPDILACYASLVREGNKDLAELNDKARQCFMELLNATNAAARTAETPAKAPAAEQAPEPAGKPAKERTTSGKSAASAG